MADDSVTLNDANDAPFKVAVDTVGQRDFQVVKLAVGAEDTATYVSSAQGATDSGTVRTVAASDDPGVAAAQTANTLLTNIDGHIDGVEALIGTTNTSLAATNTLLTTQNTYLDTVETLIGSTNALLTTQSTYLDGVETAIGATNTAVGTTNSLLTTQASYLDGLETAAGTTNTLLTTQNTYLDTVETLIGSTNTKLDTVNTNLTTVATELPKTPLLTTSDLTYTFNTSSSSGETTLVSATASQTTKVYRATVTAAAATVVEFRDGASGTALRTFEFPAAGAYVIELNGRPLVKTTDNTALIRNSTVATKVTVALDYVKS